LELQQRQATPAAVPGGLLPESALAPLHGLQVGPTTCYATRLASTLSGSNASRKSIDGRP